MKREGKKISQRKKQCGRNNKTAFEPSLGYIFFIHWKACFAAAFPTHAAEGDVSKSQIASLLISVLDDGQKLRRTARLVQAFYLKTTVKHLLYSFIHFASYPFKLNVVPYRMASSPSLPALPRTIWRGTVVVLWSALTCDVWKMDSLGREIISKCPNLLSE